MKIVINKCFGGFGLSMLAQKEYLKRKGKESFFYKQTRYQFKEGKDKFVLIEDTKKHNSCGDPSFCSTRNLGKTTEKWPNEEDNFYYGNIERTDPDLVAVVEKLNDAANGWAANLVVVDIPDGVEYSIDDYDGVESVHEAHEVWG